MRWNYEKIPVLCGPQFNLKLFYTFERCNVILEVHIDPTLQDNVLLPDAWLTLSHPVWIDSGWESIKKGRHAVFFTAVNPMFVDGHEEVEYDLMNPRIAVFKKQWKLHQNTVCWCISKVCQKKGLQFYQTRSNAIILSNTFLAICIEKVVFMKVSRRIIQQSTSVCEKPYPSRIWNMDGQFGSEDIRRPSKQRNRRVRRNPWW